MDEERKMRALPSACPSASLPGSLSRHLGTAVTAICWAGCEGGNLVSGKGGRPAAWRRSGPRERVEGEGKSAESLFLLLELHILHVETRGLPRFFLTLGDRVQSSFSSLRNKIQAKNISHMQHQDLRSNKSANIKAITSLILSPCGRGLPHICLC